MERLTDNQKLLNDRIKLIESLFIGKTSFGSWFSFVLAATTNPFSYSRIGLFDPVKARENKARRELSHELKICAYCLKPKKDARRLNCSTSCTKSFNKDFNEWLVSWEQLRYDCLERDGWKCKK